MSLVDTTTGEIVAPVGRQIMPPLSNAERAALRVSIERFGVLVPVLVDQNGDIIDGHNRVEIADELHAHIEYETVTIRDEAHAREIAESVNLDRRHLDEVTRKAVFRSLRESGHSLRAIAGAHGVSKSTVANDLADYQVSSDWTPDTPVEPEPIADPEPERVTGTDGKQYPSRANKWTDEALLNLLDLYVGGLTQQVLSEMHNVSQSQISSLLTQARPLREQDGFTVANPPKGSDNHRIAVAARRRIAAELAATGHTSRQIADRLGVSHKGARSICVENGIDVPADAVVGVTRRLDSNRIVNETVTGIDGYCLGLSLVDFAELDPDQVAPWSESLRSSIKTLNRFLKEMTK